MGIAHGTMMTLDGVVTWAEIDLDAIAHNVKGLKAFVGPQTQLIASVKANAYGHGLLPVARTVLKAGASRLAVHRIQAGIALREGGITVPILLLGHIPPAGVQQVLRYQLTPTIVDRETATALAAQATETVPVHVKVDTGMSRYGLEPEKVLDLIRYIARLPHLQLEGVFSHFATADEADLSFARAQFRRFQAVLQAITADGHTIQMPHIGNSAGTITIPEAHMAAVRPGVLLYGMQPSEHVHPPFALHRALTLKSRVIHVRALSAGQSISYGRTYITPTPMRAALVSLGYGDGYPRAASNRGMVLIRGRRAPIRGRICMDQFVVEVTHIPKVRVGDEVVAIGQQGDEEITAAEVAAWAGTINYEITTGLLPQVVRIYHQNGHDLAPENGLKQWNTYLKAI